MRLLALICLAQLALAMLQPELRDTMQLLRRDAEEASSSPLDPRSVDESIYSSALLAGSSADKAGCGTKAPPCGKQCSKCGGSCIGKRADCCSSATGLFCPPGKHCATIKRKGKKLHVCRKN